MVSDTGASPRLKETGRLNPCSNGIWSLTPRSLLRALTIVLSLNPCSNGIWSLTTHRTAVSCSLTLGLNPCSNGIWSLTLDWSEAESEIRKVLILVLMEYGL